MRIKNDFIVIVGCGRVGSALASELSRRGSRVVILDVDEAKFANLDPDFSGFRVVGDAVEQETLRNCKVGKASVLISVTAKDNVNLMVAETGREIFNVPLALARVHVAERESLFREFGVVTVNPSTMVVAAFLEALSDRPNR